MTEYDGDVHEQANDWESGFTPRTVDDPPEPQLPKPRCAVDGCERVVYKSVVCRKHWDEVPIALRLRRAADAMVAQQVAKTDTDLAISELAATWSAEPS